MESKQSTKIADQVLDNARVSENPKLFPLLDANEKLLYSEIVKKFSACGFFKKERILVITSENIYNAKKCKLRRKIPLSQLAGITKQMLGSKEEFVFHIKGAHDYRYLIRDTDQRSVLIETMKQLYAEKFHQNLPIFGVEVKKGLKEFTTCGKIARQGRSLMPPIQFRLNSENLIKEE